MSNNSTKITHLTDLIDTADEILTNCKPDGQMDAIRKRKSILYNHLLETRDLLGDVCTRPFTPIPERTPMVEIVEKMKDLGVISSQALQVKSDDVVKILIDRLQYLISECDSASLCKK